MSGNVFDSYALDQDAENNGVWVEFRGGVQIRLRSDSSDMVRKWGNRRVKSQRQQIIANGGVLPPELADKNDVAMCADVLIVDWKNVVGRDGKPLPYNLENARMLVTELPALRREIMFASRSEETFRPDTDALGKTSATPSQQPSASTGE